LGNSVDRPAPAGTGGVRVIGPEVAKIRDPWYVEGSAQAAGKDETGKRRRTRKDDIGPPRLDQTFASGNGGLYPVDPGVGQGGQGIVMAPQPVPGRRKRGCIGMPMTLWARRMHSRRATPERPSENIDPRGAYRIIGVDDMLSWYLHR